jgi:sigma-B regulation protein RsbU (phosphoserine phosphatase)
MILIVISNSVRFNGENVQSDNSALLGGILLMFVLILELKDKLLAKSELEEGRAIQKLLMPPESPAVNGWKLWLYTYPANEVGGDLVDFINIDEARNAVIIADVAGKGLKAALLMAKLQATIRAVVSDFISLEKLAAKVNVIFHRDSPASLFASFLYSEIKPESGSISFVNAGHFPPIIIKTEGFIEMEKGSAALGLMQEAKYKEQKIELKSGEIFLAYSDGLIEAQNENGEFFGTERLFNMLSSIKSLEPQSIGKMIISEVNRFVGDAIKFDDLSLIVMKKN